MGQVCVISQSAPAFIINHTCDRRQGRKPVKESRRRSPEYKLERLFGGKRVVFPADPLVATDAALQWIQTEVGLTLFSVDQLSKSSAESTVLGEIAVVRVVQQLDAAASSVALRNEVRHQTVCMRSPQNHHHQKFIMNKCRALQSLYNNMEQAGEILHAGK